MAAMNGYSSERTALLIVDPYNDFMSEGGKLYEATRKTAEAVGFYDNMRKLIPTIRATRIQVIIVPHHRWREGDYVGWKHMNPTQVRANQSQGFAAGSWGGEFHPEFGPRDGDVVVLEHWAQSGFANTDLDAQLKQRGIEKIILVGFVANTCIEGTARFGMELGYHITLIKDATAAFDQEGMHAAHEVNGPRFAHAILTTEELLTSLQSASSPLSDANKTVESGFAERFGEVNGVRLRYFIGGKGSPVVLLHGYAETSHMWYPIMPLLAQRHTVVVPDLRGAGGSAKPESGYDKKNMAVDIHELTSSLGFDRVSIVGHDIGLMVAYAFAAQFPQATEQVVLMDAFLPGIGSWKDVWLLRDLWHFHFYGDVPLALVQGRERTYFEHFWNDFAADPKHSIPEADRRIYAQAYAQPGGMRAGFEYFRNFERDAQDFAQLGATRLAMPVLVLTGEKASGNFLIEQAKLVASDVRGQVVMGVGHWLMEEAPQTVIPAILDFITAKSNAVTGRDRS